MKSKNIMLGLLLVAAGACPGCGGNQDYKRCVDKNGVVLSDEECHERHPRYLGHHSHWYYGGSGLLRGETVRGGSYTASSGMHYGTPSSGHISRGGFGFFSGFHSSGG